MSEINCEEHNRLIIKRMADLFAGTSEMDINLQDSTVSVPEARIMLCLEHDRTVQRYIREGKLKAYKIGRGYRVTKDSIAAFIKAARVNTNNIIQEENEND